MLQQQNQGSRSVGTEHTYNRNCVPLMHLTDAFAPCEGARRYCHALQGDGSLRGY